MDRVSQPFLDPAAVLWSAQPEALADRPLLVLLHGVGANEGDLFSLSPALPLGPVVASLRAPLRHGPGWSWYELGTPGEPRSDLVDTAALGVLAWLDALPVQPPAVALLGFSQGAAVTAQALRHAPDRFACTVQLSGYVTSGELAGDAVLARLRPPVFYGRGTVDDVIPAVAVEHTDSWLRAHTDVDARIYEGLPHAVSTEELTDVVAFLRRHLG
ncbi:MAG: Phospholipase [Naasia sp.]|nr:Phospholipase [Naasia sp.]